MSQLFDYFVCSRPAIERWADALEQQDEDVQKDIEDEMPRFLCLKNVGQDEFNILAACAQDEADTVRAVGRLDLIKAVSEEEGPWIIAFRQAEIEAIAGMNVDHSLVERWVRAVVEYRDESEDDCRDQFTTELAKTLKELCGVAVEKQLGVFTCFYG